MKNLKSHLIYSHQSVKEALAQMNQIEGLVLTLFVLDEEHRMAGTVTDGDVRRGLLKNVQLSDPVSEIMNASFRYIQRNQFGLDCIEKARQDSIKLLPFLDEEFRILRVIDFSEKKSVLPVDAVIMAGGKGTRLKPLTDTTPKPLLKVGGKPIIEYNIDRLSTFGVDNIFISIRYLGEQLVEYFGNGENKEIAIDYIMEDEPLGTMGAVRKVDGFLNDYVLVMNSDLLTNIDFEDFFKAFIENESDFSVATTPFLVKVPYAVLEVDGHRIESFKEKPTYTYYSNAGIYLFKRELIDHIPIDSFFDATDFMDTLIQAGKKVTHYPILGYWLDIGKPEDFVKAQEDIKRIQF